MSADPLRQFLMEELDFDTDQRLQRLLEPLYERARSPKYALLPEAEVDLPEIRLALTTATLKQVSRMHFLSCSGSFRRVEGRPTKSIQESIADQFRDNLCDTLRASLGNTLWVSLQASMRVSMLVNLQECLSNTLGAGLKSSLRAALGERLWEGLGTSLWNSVWDSLFYFVGFTVAGKKTYADRLEPLIRLFPKCLPVDEKKDAPGVWIVLVA